MRFRIGNGLPCIAVLTLALIIAVSLFEVNVLRIILGLPFLLFFPGYVLILALFPKRDSLGGIERIALSFGLSIAVVPLIGLGLNYTTLGITVESTLYSVSLFIFALSLFAWIRRRKLPHEERFDPRFNIDRPSLGKTGWDKALSVILVISIVGAVGVLGYVIANPKVGEKFTEFYVLGEQGQAAEYPEEIVLGDSAKVIVGIINHEQAVTIYRVEVVASGETIGQLNDVSLDDEEVLEENLVFTPISEGSDQKIEFFLFKVGDSSPFLSLHLYVDVLPSS